MSERETIPTEAAACNWASDGVTYSSADPGAPKRLTGFQPKDEPGPGPGEVIPAEDHNWLWRVGMEMITWLRDTIEREWRDVHEGIAGSSSGGGLVFKVVQPLGSPSALYTRLQQLWNTAPGLTTGGNILQVCTDGEQIYYIGGAAQAYVGASSPATGLLIWERQITPIVTAVTTDGAFIYYQSDGTKPGLRKIVRTDGSLGANGGAEHSCSRLVTNGVYAVGLNGTVGGANSVTFWTVATPTETGTVTPAGAITASAIDADQVYVGGTRNGGFDVRCLNLATRATTWSVALDGNDPSPVNAIIADGDCVYVGCDSFALAAGGNASLFCLNRVNGALLWTIDHADIDALAVDDKYLYAVDGSNNLQMIAIRQPVPSIVATSTNTGIYIAADGVSVVASSSFAATQLLRDMSGVAAKAFQLAEGTDPSRRPFFNLAVPVDK